MVQEYQGVLYRVYFHAVSVEFNVDNVGKEAGKHTSHGFKEVCLGLAASVTVRHALFGDGQI